MTSLTPLDGLDFCVAGHYVLVSRISPGSPVRTRVFRDFPDLARAVARNMYTPPCWSRPLSEGELLCAVSPRGKLLALDEVAAYGQRLRQETIATRLYPGYTRRQGPVHGVRCRRGSWKCFRQIGTQGSLRQAALVLHEEGEVPPRARRNAANLPTAWDDLRREVEHSWKAQHKGRKSWDRRR